MECASFADEIKQTGMKSLSDWHFIDTPIFVGDYKKDLDLQYQNISWAIVSIKYFTF